MTASAPREDSPAPQPYRSVWTRWWSGHVVTLGLATLVLVLSVGMTPSTGFLDLGGVTIPELCAWRRLFGIECLGCGMTRSFVFMGHGDVRAAWDMNHIGPILFTVTALQLPYRAVRLWWGPTARDRAREARRAARLEAAAATG